MMTSETNAPDGAPGAQQPDAKPARRRMAGYTPRQQENGSAAESGHDGRSRTTGGPVTGPRPADGAGPAAGTSPAGGDSAVPTAAAQGTGAPVRKTRMGGGPARASSPAATPASSSAVPGGNTAVDASAVPAGGPADAASASPKRTRMGAGAAGAGAGNRQRMGGAGQVQTSGANASTAPAAAKTRMGGTAAATAAKTRMGEASTAPAASAKPSVTAPTGTRMGAPASPPAGPPSPAASSATVVPSGRAGTPGPAGAATPNVGRPAWVRPVLVIAGLVVVALVVVLAARWLRTLEGVQEFIATYDGHASQPDTAPVGIPGWLGWQHFFNMFFIVLIIRTGLQVRTERKPPAYWTAKPDSFFSPQGNTPKKVSVTQWLHQSLDVLWVLNGVIFVVLLFATGHWMRIVPTSWDIVPNMASAGIQYASLDWPVENGWVHYNALQVMAYFLTVFIAAPLAIITGIRISTWWPERAERLTKIYPVEWARALHFPVMLYFVAFTIVHVFLVFFTGALRNLNHMYTSRDVVDWWGLIVFLASLIVLAAAWFLTKPLFTTPVASRMGKVTK